MHRSLSPSSFPSARNDCGELLKLPARKSDLRWSKDLREESSSNYHCSVCFLESKKDFSKSTPSSNFGRRGKEERSPAQNTRISAATNLAAPATTKTSQRRTSHFYRWLIVLAANQIKAIFYSLIVFNCLIIAMLPMLVARIHATTAVTSNTTSRNEIRSTTITNRQDDIYIGPENVYELSSSKSFQPHCQQLMANKSITLQSAYCGYFNSNDVIPKRLRTGTFHTEKCQEMYKFMHDLENTVQLTIESFTSVINRLSCTPKFQTDFGNNLRSVNGTLHDDAYSLCSTCSECLNAYREWACGYYFATYNDSDIPTDEDKLRHLCWETSRWCPLLIPIDAHSGQSFFICSDTRLVHTVIKRPIPCFTQEDQTKDYCYLPISNSSNTNEDSKNDVNSSTGSAKNAASLSQQNGYILIGESMIAFIVIWILSGNYDDHITSCLLSNEVYCHHFR
ncbi:hypothetical protein GJ496_008780 [Pomphorhynchus laevis]|nr:hypothetical protein GJ496_008780 [Pomphorhynchus laevis]